MDVRLPDGTILRGVPEGTTKEQIMAKMGGKAPAGRQGGIGEKIGAVTSGLADAMTFGFSDEIQSALNAVAPLDRLTRPETASMWDTGSSFKDAYNKNLEMKRARDAYDEKNHFGLRLAGQLPGAIATGIGTGGASIGLRGAGLAAGEGAAYGFGSGQDGVENRLASAGIGGAGGLAGYGLGRVVSKALAPKTAPVVKKLMDEGVDLTPGQIAGGVGKTIEDKLTSVPVLGDAIQSARARGVESFNKAAVNRSLKHIGEKLPNNVKAGYEAIDYAQNAVSKAYNDLLPKLSVKVDKPFKEAMGNLVDMANEMPKARVKQFKNIMSQQIAKRLSQNGSMTGEAMKEAESELSRLIRQYGGSASGDERLLGNALREAQNQLRKLVMRSNPSKAIKLKSINRAFAELLRPERAASMAKDGIFTPGQLQTATRVLDSSGRKKASAMGGALMQDLATNAREVLPSSIPDSGTAGRLLMPIIAGGSAYGVTSDDPRLQTLGALGLLGSGLYTKTGQKAMQTLLTQRPELLQLMGNQVAKTPLGVAGGVLATNP